MEGRTASARVAAVGSRAAGGRSAPDVRVEGSLPFWRELAPGLLAGWPFLLVGILSVTLGVLLYVRAIRLFPSSPLPVWVLFLGIGIIALAGAAIGAITPEEERPRLSPRPSRTVAPKPVPPPSPAPVAARTPPPDVTEEELPEGDPWDEEHEPLLPADPAALAAIFSLPVPRPVTPYSGDLGPDGLPLDPPERETGEVLAQLEQLTTLLRPVRSYRPVSGGTTFVRYCIGCERRLPEEGELRTCSACHGALCPDCASAALRSGVGGKCPTCATLEEASPGTPMSDGPP